MMDFIYEYGLPLTIVAASGWMLANVLFLTYGSRIFHRDE